MISSSVVSPIADTTTITGRPWRRCAHMRRRRRGCARPSRVTSRRTSGRAVRRVSRRHALPDRSGPGCKDAPETLLRRAVVRTPRRRRPRLAVVVRTAPGPSGPRLRCRLPSAPACIAASSSVAPAGNSGSRYGWWRRSRVASASSVGPPGGERGDQQARARDVEQRIGERHAGGQQPRACTVGHAAGDEDHRAQASTDAGHGDLHHAAVVARATATRTPPSRHGTTLSGCPSSARPGRAGRPRSSGSPRHWLANSTPQAIAAALLPSPRLNVMRLVQRRSKPGYAAPTCAKTARAARRIRSTRRRGHAAGLGDDLVPQVQRETQAIEARAEIGARGWRAHDDRRRTIELVRREAWSTRTTADRRPG